MIKPIIFTGDMVQAILEGRKTVTRRVVRPQPHPDLRERTKHEKHPKLMTHFETYNPKYKVGDILWVRETWRIGAWNEDRGAIAVDYKADNYSRREWLNVPDPDKFNDYWIQSTDEAIAAGLKYDADGQYHWKPGEAPTRWRPSIHMPKEAARIFLKVTDVRVERLKEITGEQAIKEGIGFGNNVYGSPKAKINYARIKFKGLWDSINALRGYGWDINPWVWVIEFERAEKPEGWPIWTSF